MAFNPEEQPFKLTSERVLAREMEKVATAYARERAQIVEALSARGMGQSGAVLAQTESLSGRLIREFGAAVVPELFELLEAACGDPPPPEALAWLRKTIDDYTTSLVKGHKERAAEQRRRMHVSDSGAGHEAEIAGRGVLRDLDIALGKMELRARMVHPPAEAAPKGVAKYDAFISHASEDKASVAEPLAAELGRRGYNPWLDKFELKIGDRLMAKIDEGLASSRYGVVILSHSFFRKGWATWELNALAALEATRGRKTILPIWHGLTKDDVAGYSPLLSGILGVPADVGVAAMADEIEKALQE